jgi:hypothetical protein
MARQLGAIKYKGTIGEVRHFKIKGLKGHYAGLKGGPTKEQILNDPEFQRTRENMSEFGGSATAAKSVRVGFAEVLGNTADARLAGRLTKTMKKINLMDTAGTRGRRSILISQNTQYLTGVNFNRGANFDSIFYAPIELTNSVDRTSSTLTIPNFNQMNLVNAPSGATHFRIINAIAVVSDFVFNSSTGLYEAVDLDNNELSNIQYTGYISLSDSSASAAIDATLPGSPTLTADVSVLNAVGIEFYQQVGSDYYLFTQGNAMKIQTIF